jgi:hypothetical protein
MATLAAVLMPETKPANPAAASAQREDVDPAIPEVS